MIRHRTLILIALLAGFALVLFGAGHVGAGQQVKLCHVTDQVLPNGKCHGVVIAVGAGAVDAHLSHGDVIPGNPDAFDVGQQVEMACSNN